MQRNCLPSLTKYFIYFLVSFWFVYFIIISGLKKVFCAASSPFLCGIDFLINFFQSSSGSYLLIYLQTYSKKSWLFWKIYETISFITIYFLLVLLTSMNISAGSSNDETERRQWITIKYLICNFHLPYKP